MSIPQGGYAFPSLLDKDMTGNKTQFLGMTLRDYFAAKWLQGFIANSSTPDDSHEVVAGHAYMVADAMLRARES